MKHLWHDFLHGLFGEATPRGGHPPFHFVLWGRIIMQAWLAEYDDEDDDKDTRMHINAFGTPCEDPATCLYMRASRAKLHLATAGCLVFLLGVISFAMSQNVQSLIFGILTVLLHIASWRIRRVLQWDAQKKCHKSGSSRITRSDAGVVLSYYDQQAEDATDSMEEDDPFHYLVGTLIAVRKELEKSDDAASASSKARIDALLDQLGKVRSFATDIPARVKDCKAYKELASKYAAYLCHMHKFCEAPPDESIVGVNAITDAILALDKEYLDLTDACDNSEFHNIFAWVFGECDGYFDIASVEFNVGETLAQIQEKPQSA